MPRILQYSFTPFRECVGIPSYWVQFAQQPATEEGHVPLVQGHSDQVRGHMTITMTTSLLQPLLHAKHSIGDCLSPSPPPLLSHPALPCRYNISQLEEWSRTHGMVRSGVVEQLQPVVQAVKLLQMRKSNEEDVKTICELCCELNPLQVRRHTVSLQHWHVESEGRAFQPSSSWSSTVTFTSVTGRF